MLDCIIDKGSSVYLHLSVTIVIQAWMV